MLVDIQMAKAQTDYKREQLTKSFRSGRKTTKATSRVHPWRRLRVRKPSVA